MLVCPVPLEQRPILEYKDLKEAWFFGWASAPWFNFLKPIVLVWLISWLLTAPIAQSSFPMHKLPLQFSLSAAGGALIIPVLLLIRLYFGWIYIQNRLRAETIEYEESGWYDGQKREKTAEILQRNRLIASYEVAPILGRLHRVFVSLMGLVVCGSIVWIWVG